MNSSAAAQPEASICRTAHLVQLTRGRAIERGPETTPFVKEQQSRAALPLLVRSGGGVGDVGEGPASSYHGAAASATAVSDVASAFSGSPRRSVVTGARL